MFKRSFDMSWLIFSAAASFSFIQFSCWRSLSIFNLEDNAEKGLLSMLSIILIIVPLVSLIFSTIYMYNSANL